MNESSSRPRPMIHLEQIERLKLTEAISSPHITGEVRDEVGKAIIQKIDLEVRVLEAGKTAETVGL